MIGEMLFFFLKDALFLLGYLARGSAFPKPLSRAEEARALGMERPAYANYEVGRIERFDISAVERMSCLYSVPMNDLLDEYNAFLQSRQDRQMIRWRTSLGLSRKGMPKGSAWWSAT